MKKVIVALVLLISVSSMAQKGGNEHHNRSENLTPEQMATLQTKKMTLALDLSEAQQSQIQAFNLENAKARKARHEEHKAMKEDGERKKPTAEERFAMKNERLDHQISQKAELKKILSDAQYEKWEKMSHRKGHHKKGKRGKGRKGPKKEGSK